MQAHLQGVEVEAACGGDDNLAVHDHPRRQVRETDVVQFRKIAVERLQIAALDVDVVAAAKDDRAKPVPLRLEQIWSGRNRLRDLGEHRLDGWIDRKGHRTSPAYPIMSLTNARSAIESFRDAAGQRLQERHQRVLFLLREAERTHEKILRRIAMAAFVVKGDDV